MNASLLSKQAKFNTLTKTLKTLWARLNWYHGAAIAGLLLTCLVFWWTDPMTVMNLFTPARLQQVVSQSGNFGPIIYITVLALSVIVCQIPGVPLAMAAGAIWGPMMAGIYSVIGGFLGGLIAYFIGNKLGRGAIEGLTGKVIYFSEQRGEAYIGWLIFATRLLPVLSFDLISYGAGITGLSLPIYSSATFFGMIPSTFLLTYMGDTFTAGLSLGVGLTVILLVLLIALPWGINRYNWFNLKEIICVD